MQKSLLRNLSILARPHHYVKNGFVLLPLFFGHQFAHLSVVLRCLTAFAAFCLAASAIYIYNDMRDVRADRLHPAKRNRPLASGAVTSTQAVASLFLLLLLAFGVSFAFLPWLFSACLGCYVVLNLLYSWRLKRAAIVDVTCVAIGFVIRVVGGAIVAAVAVSHWIILVTFLLALFLALAKRRSDVVLYERDGIKPRQNIDSYNLEFVSAGMVVMASVTIVSYVLYTVSPEVMAVHGTNKLYLTSFWVVLGFLRYMQLTFVEGKSDSPTRLLFSDLFLKVTIVGWLATFYVIFSLR
jgi:decaprenyl-phosphate phosphoribosyltransferase